MKKNEAIINNYFLEEIKGDALSNDPDNTKISREFYAEYWAKPFGADINLYNGKNNNYRGETIISFNTIAGALIRMTRRYENNGYSIEENSNNKDSERLEYIISSDEDFIDEKLKKSFKEFNQLFHSLSNFMPLVKTEIGSNLNNVKARGKYHDFPDIFLKDIQNYYKGEDSNPKFNVKVNSEYFEKFGSWKNFVESNYLQSFFNKEDHLYKDPIKLFPMSDDFPFRANHIKVLTGEDRRAYISKNTSLIQLFLNEAIDIIKKRADLLSKER